MTSSPSWLGKLIKKKVSVSATYFDLSFKQIREQQNGKSNTPTSKSFLMTFLINNLNMKCKFYSLFLTKKILLTKQVKKNKCKKPLKFSFCINNLL